jgi:hypothetical protein
MTNEDIAKDILKNNDEDSVLDAVSESIYDYIDSDWEDEYEDIHEAYGETGRGEAESQILHQIIEGWQKETDTNLSIDNFCEVFDILKEEWCLSTD